MDAPDFVGMTRGHGRDSRSQRRLVWDDAIRARGRIFIDLTQILQPGADENAGQIKDCRIVGTQLAKPSGLRPVARQATGLFDLKVADGPTEPP
jgi:hypothetical protein